MMKKITTILLLSSFLYSCGPEKHFKKGDEAYSNLRYSSAIEYYQKGLEKQKDFVRMERLADAYRLNNNYTQAESYYKEVITSGKHSPSALFHYARIEMGKGNYGTAIKYFELYLEKQPNDAVTKMLLASCRSVNERYRDTTLYELTILPTPEFTNSFGVTEYDKGIVFTGEKEEGRERKSNPWTGQSYLDLYYMEKDEKGNWLSPVLLEGEINGRYHEGPASFSGDNNTIFFTRSNYTKRKLNLNEEFENNLKIFTSKKTEGKWSTPIELSFNSDDYSCGHPTLSEDGAVLYFVSDMPGGIGGTDIYRSRFVDGRWQKPENLGEPINTTGNEMFPYIHSDGTLFFSSDAHNSMGGLDVFMTFEYGNRWMQPENLNYPVNTKRDDFAFSLSNDNVTGFVSSTRTDRDDIYSIKKKDPTFNLYGFARKKGTDIPVEGVTVAITKTSDGKEITMVSGKDGKFKLKLEKEQEYALLCTKFGCFSRTDKISTIGLKYSQDFYADFEVEEIIIDKPIVLENIYYDFDKWAIREDAAKELDKLVRLLKDNPNIHIEMGSHTDARGTDRYNMVLSDKRAKAAVDYLIFRGIDPARLTWKGYGETVPVNKCINKVECSEEEHQQNRRTEFKVKNK